LTQAFVALGSNRGDRGARLRFAFSRLAELPETRLVGQSRIYETRALGPGFQRHYLNAVAELVTELPAPVLLAQLHSIEAAAGRRRTSLRWGPRELDLDLLLYGDTVSSDPSLLLPHPRLAERAFVLEPLAELAPDTIHPLRGDTIQALAQRVRDGAHVWLWPGRFNY
jgi:2-amino-4-hydroxy-6-hydroxymethyldihydropteridine diphosphokinase